MALCVEHKRFSPRSSTRVLDHRELTVEQARIAAAKTLAKAELGEDEAARRAEARTAKMVAELCELYLVEGCDRKKASTVYVDRGRIARHIVPLLGRKLVSAIASDEIERFMQDVAKGKTATSDQSDPRQSLRAHLQRDQSLDRAATRAPL